MKSEVNEKTYNLSNIIEEIIKNGDDVGEPGTFYKRFKTLNESVSLIDLETIKNEKGEISFYEPEKELIKALLIEMGEPFLQRAISKKAVGKSLKEGIEQAEAFKKRMIARAEHLEDGEFKESWYGLVNFLSRLELRKASQELFGKMQSITDFLMESNLEYEEMVEIIDQLNQSFDNWIHVNLENRTTQKK